MAVALASRARRRRTSSARSVAKRVSAGSGSVGIGQLVDLATTSASWISASSRNRSRLLPQDQVGAHAAAGEVPDAGFVLGAVGVRVEVAHARAIRVLEQLHEVERVPDALGPEPEVLVVLADDAAR